MKSALNENGEKFCQRPSPEISILKDLMSLKVSLRRSLESLSGEVIR